MSWERLVRGLWGKLPTGSPASCSRGAAWASERPENPRDEGRVQPAPGGALGKCYGQSGLPWKFLC